MPEPTYGGLSAERLAELEARATGIVWYALLDGKKWIVAMRSTGEWVSPDEWRCNHKNDAAFVAAARNALPDLLADVGRLRAQLEDTIESLALIRAESAVNESVAAYALEQWEEWVDSELDGTATYADKKAEIAALRAQLGSGAALGRTEGEANE